MLTLEDHMEGIVNIFHQYSVLTGDPETLTKNEMRMLITRELANTIKNTKDPATINKIFQELDENVDGMVSFEEFVSLLVSVLLTTHKNIHKK
ncbi:protein S100-A12-like [Perognathus longimembris pacificus]|uniref:protein S100-A12-like n=1 Tax=Perognathus longimembris pacificus TaxID=214514 RepID=UPI00201A0BAA|nr:protein S100-A12-like [Perognathus longimembris pacificus]